jgi:hypothetical protein
MAAEVFEKGALRTFSESLGAIQETEINALNYTSVVSPSVIRNIAGERTRDRNNLDSVKEALEQRRIHEYDPLKKFPGMIRNIVFDPCAVYSYTEEQMTIFSSCIKESSWNCPIQVSCDTSGDIFPAAKTAQGKKKFYNFAMCLSSQKMKSMPLGEMLTLKVDAKNVNCFLTNYVCDLEKLNSAKTVKLPQIFCTDYTWVNIHPILNVFFKTDIHKYLADMYAQFECQESSEKSVLLLDKLHLIKFLLINCRKIAKIKYVGETFVAVFLFLLKCKTKAQIYDHWVAMIHVFGTRIKKVEYQRTIEECGLSQASEEFNHLKNSIEDNVEDDDPDYICKKPIKRSSKFYDYFKSIHDEQMSKISNEENQDINDNIFYCPKLLAFVVENYLPLFPLMSLSFVPNIHVTDIPTTSSIENHWKNVKLFFKTIPLERRYVSVYFPMMLSFFNSKTTEFLTMKKSKALQGKLASKRNLSDPTLFYPNFEKKKRKFEATEGNFYEEDGYTLRHDKNKKSTKYVRRRIDFHLIEKTVSDLEMPKKKEMDDSGIKPVKKSNNSGTLNSEETTTTKKEIPLIDTMLGLPLKEIVETKRRKPPSCILCRSVEHKRQNCPML